MSASIETPSAASPGRTTSPGDEAAHGRERFAAQVFDLDETVLTLNSFPLWVRHLMRGGPRDLPSHVRVALALRTVIATADRKLMRRPHRIYKARLQAIWGRAAGRRSTDAPDPLIDRLIAHRRPALMPMLRRVERGDVDAVLATAAVEEYAAELAMRLGFRHWLATPRGLSATEENVREAKRDAVAAFVARMGWSGRPLVVFTDHLEDLPLIGLATRLVWCGKAADLATIVARHPGLPILALNDAGPDEIEAFALG